MPLSICRALFTLARHADPAARASHGARVGVAPHHLRRLVAGALLDRARALPHACQNGVPHQLPTLPIQSRITRCGRRHGFERERRYWEEALAGAPQHVNLPFDRTPGPDRSFLGARRKLSLSVPTVRGLRELAAARDTTLSNVVLSVLSCFCSRSLAGRLLRHGHRKSHSRGTGTRRRTVRQPGARANAAERRRRDR